MAANISDDADDWVSLAQLVKIKKELNALLSKVSELQSRILEKLRAYLFYGFRECAHKLVAS